MATYKKTTLGQLRLQINALQQKVRRREDKIRTCKSAIRSLEEEEAIKGLNHTKSSKLNRQRFELKQAEEDLSNLKVNVDELMDVRNQKKLEEDAEKGESDKEEDKEEDREEAEVQVLNTVENVTDDYLNHLGLNAQQVDNQELNFEKY